MALAKNSLALFDFDNTLSLCDSFVPFALFIGGPTKFLSGAIRLLNRRLRRGPISRKEAKEIMVRSTFAGRNLDEIHELSKQYAALFIPLAMNSDQVGALIEHKKSGRRVVIVSASPETYLRTLTQQFECELIATELEVNDGKITGNISGENCRGPEKIKRISKILNLSDYESIYAYGDSAGDREMLEAATNPIFQGGRQGLYPLRKFFNCAILYFRCFLASLCVTSGSSIN